MISVVVPIYNEQETVQELYERLTAAAKVWGDAYEVVAVDDGSQDATGSLLAGIHQRDRRWKIVTFSRNFGHQPAVSAGLRHSTGEVVVVMDGDLQDPPEAVGELLAKWSEGYEVVYAVRTKRKENFLKRFAYAAFYRLLRRMSSIEIPLDAGDFCVMDRKVVDVVCSLPERAPFIRGLRSWSGFRQIGVVYERHARHAGDAKYTVSKLIHLALDGMLSFSSLPLKLSSWLGIGLCGFSGCLIVILSAWWVSGARLLGMYPGDAVGWTSLCALVLFVSGLQMLVLGIMGEYLARVFDEVKGRPTWVVRDTLGFEPRITADEGTGPTAPVIHAVPSASLSKAS